MEDTHVWLMDAEGMNRRELGGGIDNRQERRLGRPMGVRVTPPFRRRATLRLYSISRFRR